MENFGSKIDARIEVPNWMLNELKTARDFALDIGGTLVKVAYLSKTTHESAYKMSEIETTLMNSSSSGKSLDIHEEKDTRESGYSLHLVKFPTYHIETCLDFVQKRLMERRPRQPSYINCTGGGAYKYKGLITGKLSLKVEKIEEIKSLIHGCIFVLTNIKYESFAYIRDDPSPYKFKDLTGKAIYPFLLVNIGSGVSIIVVKSKDDYERVGGTSLGGGTFLGLGSLLTDAKNFEELLALASKGQHKNIDLLVGDIYGGSCNALGLPKEVIASSFAKAARFKGQLKDLYNENQVTPADIAKSLLHMISNEIGQLSSLYARIYGIKRVYFGGNFVRNNPITMHTVTYAVNYFSKGTQEANFLRHDGYLGSIGCLFMRKTRIKSYTWHEDLQVKLLLQESCRFPYLHFNTVTTLRCETKKFVSFPLVETSIACEVEPDFSSSSEKKDHSPTNSASSDYGASKDFFDSAAFLTKQNTAYWFEYLSKNVALLIENGIIPANEEGERNLRQALKNLPKHDLINIQTLTDLKEKLLYECFYPAPFLKNNHAIDIFRDEINRLDEIPNLEERLAEILLNIFAGNFFDVGSNEFLELMLQHKDRLTFNYVRDLLKDKMKLISRPMNMFITDFKNVAWRKISIFLDNSGYDVILGIFPLVREFIKCNIEVVLIANSYLALNDVIFAELKLLCDRVSFICPIISEALAKERLKLAETGLGSPCFDLRFLDPVLVKIAGDSDLIVLEGPQKLENCLIA